MGTTVSAQEISDGVVISGSIPKAKRDQELASYTLTAKEGKQFTRDNLENENKSGDYL